MDDITEKTLSNFVETQFPEFYLTDGPTFILFVKKYYEWLEGSQEVAVPFTKGTVSFTSANGVVTGQNTFFESQFEAGDKIGLFYDNTEDSYEIFKIASVDSDLQLTLDDETLPAYSANSALFGTVKVEYNPNYHIRRLSEYSDVDTTTDEFILFFKEKYLKNIQFTTKTNTRQLIKHSLDLYRSKGTIRGLQLLFRLVFGRSVDVYYPGTDVFKLSSGEWFVPKYLELSLKDKTVDLVNKQIVGLQSGATAFIESVVRRIVKGKIIDLAYISSIEGTFVTNEYINATKEPLDIDDCPAIIGSLNSVEISLNGTGSGYAIGDVVDVYSINGEQAKARVANVSTIAGVVTFELIDGGYGYLANAEVLISEKVLQVNNTLIDTATSVMDTTYQTFETLTQPLANIAYVNANNTFESNQAITAYYANGSQSGTGWLLVANSTNSTVGSLLIAPYTGNLATSYLGIAANAVVCNIGSFTDITASGNVLGSYANCTIKANNALSTDFRVGATVYQVNALTLSDSANGVIVRYSADFGSNSFIGVANMYGAFTPSKPLAIKGSSNTCNILNITTDVGVINISNNFVDYYGNRVYTDSNTVGNVAIVSSGTGANLTMSNSFNYTENILINDDYLADYAAVALNAASYGFPAMPSANANTIIADALNFANITVGKFTAISGSSQGSQYNLAPIVKLFSKPTYLFQEKDVVMQVANISGVFAVGELVTQSGVNSRGLVTFANSSLVKAQLLRVLPENYFVTTSNSTTYLTGTDSGVTANVVSVSIDNNSEYIGINADIDTTTTTANGAIQELDVFQSGFAFKDGDIVNFTANADSQEGTGHGVVQGYGKSAGFYRQKGGFLSDTKYLFDGVYYQDYSYEIRSSVMLSRYEDMLRKIMHIPGTKYFGAFVYDSVNESTIDAESSIITQS